VSWNGEPWSWESVPDILDYVKFAGFDVTREQLARLHRRRLVNQPFNGPNGGRGHTTMYPTGTAERLLRISQLKVTTKQLDELAWRLWWEGHDVELELVRAFLMKKAGRWDEQAREYRVEGSIQGGSEELAGERDVLEEVFFQHLKAGPSLASARRQLARGSELYIDFAGLLIDLLRSDLSTLDAEAVDLFTGPFSTSGGGRARSSVVRRVGVAATVAMRTSMETPYTVVVEQLDDKEIISSRLAALRFLGIIANVGAIVQDVFGGSGRGRDNIGKSLAGVSESTDEQVLSLLLTSAFLREEVVRAQLPEFEPLTVHLPAVKFTDFLRLRYLVGEVAGLELLLAPDRTKDAFDSAEGAEQWRADLEGFLHDHILEIDEAFDRRRDLFGESPPDFGEVEAEEEGNGKKKNPK
jgi:hypothetical protein